MKLTTYQKQKQEITRLRSEIRILVMEPDSFHALEINAKHRMKFGLVESIMFGERTKPDEQGRFKIEGITGMIVRNPKIEPLIQTT